MTDQGYEPDKLFNAIHGATRLNYHDPARDRPIDVLLDKFVMAHELDLRGRARTAARRRRPTDVAARRSAADEASGREHQSQGPRRHLRAAARPRIRRGLTRGADLDCARILAVTKSDWGFEHTIHKHPRDAAGADRRVRPAGGCRGHDRGTRRRARRGPERRPEEHGLEDARPSRRAGQVVRGARRGPLLDAGPRTGSPDRAPTAREWRSTRTDRGPVPNFAPHVPGDSQDPADNGRGYQPARSGADRPRATRCCPPAPAAPSASPRSRASTMRSTRPSRRRSSARCAVRR